MDNIYAARTAFNGKSAIQVREATAAQHAEWKRSRDQAISDGEIDLDAFRRKTSPRKLAELCVRSQIGS
jgi:hypothetical protein